MIADTDARRFELAVQQPYVRRVCRRQSLLDTTSNQALSRQRVHDQVRE